MKIKKFFINIWSQLNSILIVFNNLFKKRETIMYPEQKVYLSPRYRGRIILTCDKNNNERCVACNLCAVVCPVGCISLKRAINPITNRSYPKFFNINLSRCIFCGFCEEACPTGAIQLIPDFELCEFDRKTLIYQKKHLLINNVGKYPDYDYYSVSGVKIHNKTNKKIIPDNFIDVKSLLP
ncbi:NADH-quinone oxidoreductase subunit NuoI [Enterobacteriaceae endosymbiont of Macroplea mutica]|uniref:NADH-quinone oxidoreductase subunit NuoI n=1 Tax=Enterobacteriaceae endosymbiont of Macroplea mutica TaxID=2675791 RepID=UPI001449C14E|nr:NADH-quinone oxidoreductase subunit NuoI [Enterobacteriaceae endosymbiont of Macroplea mutica]QJC31377.1 NADH-quinone oxidoreductase subunit NuoI [Enterobacteriaceae endosymbiont of Macroplea mutica]